MNLFSLGQLQRRHSTQKEGNASFLESRRSFQIQRLLINTIVADYGILRAYPLPTFPGILSPPVNRLNGPSSSVILE